MLITVLKASCGGTGAKKHGSLRTGVPETIQRGPWNKVATLRCFSLEYFFRAACKGLAAAARAPLRPVTMLRRDHQR